MSTEILADIHESKKEIIDLITAAGITRLEFSRIAGFKYSNLQQKINGFSAWKHGERERVISVLKDLIAQKGTVEE